MTSKGKELKNTSPLYKKISIEKLFIKRYSRTIRASLWRKKQNQKNFDDLIESIKFVEKYEASHETLKEFFAKLEGVMRCEMFDKIVELKKDYEKEFGKDE